MGKLSSSLVATIQFVSGIYIFKKPEVNGCGPLISSLLVLTALFFVLWTIPVYPKHLRKLVSIGDPLAQYLITVFWIEYLMGCFWFPLETAVLAFLPKTATFLEETLMMIDVPCHYPCDLLRKEGTGMFMSYLLSFLILVAALHATRIINLSLLTSGGVSPFVLDINRRSQHFMKSLPRRIGIPNKNKRPRNARKPSYCTSDDDDTIEFDADQEFTDGSDYHYSYR